MSRRVKGPLLPLISGMMLGFVIFNVLVNRAHSWSAFAAVIVVSAGAALAMSYLVEWVQHRFRGRRPPGKREPKNTTAG